MAITLNGTTGVTTPAVTNEGAYTGDGVVFADATPSNTLVTTTGGNVGIGTSSPGTKLDAYNSSTTSTVLRARNDSVSVYLDANNGYSYLNTFSNHPMLFGTNNIEAMRIDSSRNLLVGTTSPLTSSTHSFVNSGAFGVLTLKNSNIASNYWITGPNSSNNYVVITQSGVGVVLSNGSTSWASASDERLKTDLTPIENAITKVNQLRCVTGRYKTDEEDVSRSFLIAQDVQAVLPEAVDVSEDELGTLNLRYTEIIPLLVASIKEQQAIITDLKARIETLENK